MTKLLFSIIWGGEDTAAVIVAKDELMGEVHSSWRSCSDGEHPSSSSEVDLSLCKYCSSRICVIRYRFGVPVCCKWHCVLEAHPKRRNAFPLTAFAIQIKSKLGFARCAANETRKACPRSFATPRDIQATLATAIAELARPRAISITKDSSIVYHLGKLAGTKAGNNKTPIAPFSHLHALSRPSIMVAWTYMCAFVAGAHHYQTIRRFNVFLLRFSLLHVQLKHRVAFPTRRVGQSLEPVSEIPRRLCALSPALAFR